jgi:hypothetical protein
MREAPFFHRVSCDLRSSLRLNKEKITSGGFRISRCSPGMTGVWSSSFRPFDDAQDERESVPLGEGVYASFWAAVEMMSCAHFLTGLGLIQT